MVCIAKRAGQALEARGTVAMGIVWFGRQESAGERLVQPNQLGLPGTAPVYFLAGLFTLVLRVPEQWFPFLLLFFCV